MGPGEAATRLHADDVGWSSAVNASVARLLRARRLASVSVMANGAATDEALALLAHHPGVAVHVHVNLTEGRPLTSSPGLRPLVGEDGAFVGPRRLVLQLVRGRADRAAITAEVDAQVARVAAARVALVGVDTHHHVHALAPVGAAVSAVADGRGLRVVRHYGFARTHTLAGAGRKAGLALLARTTHFACDRRLALPHGWRAGDGEHAIPFAVASWEHLRPARLADPTVVVCHPGGSCDRGAPLPPLSLPHDDALGTAP